MNSVDGRGGILVGGDRADHARGVGLVDVRCLLRHLIQVLDGRHDLTDHIREKFYEDVAEQHAFELPRVRLQGPHVLQHGCWGSITQ